MKKRNIFSELIEGVAATKDPREGKLTLRSYKVDVAPLPEVDSKLLRDTRKKLRCSRAVFARKLRINERTLEKWEQGRAKMNPQAAALVLLVRKYPDTLARLDEVAGG
ncbi:MAG: helix-turn-helix domain-containing protein [Candidatus Sulfotelmatobacter sp.]